MGDIILILENSWKTFGEMAPYLLFGFLVAGGISVFISPATVERHLGKKSFWSTFKAAIFGVPLPLCSCGVIPVGASLRRHGASRGATVAFLLSTPQTGVDSIMATYGMLGPILAVFRPVVAFISGLLGGVVVDALDKEAITPPEEKPPHELDEACNCNGECFASAVRGSEALLQTQRGIPASAVRGSEALLQTQPTAPTAPTMPASATKNSSTCSGNQCCSAPGPSPTAPVPSQSRIKTALSYGLVTLPRDIARALIIGVFIAGAMGALLNEQAFVNYLGQGTGLAGELAAMGLMMLIGLPVYVCATASIPVALAFIAAGASPGAALVFLMTGPATNAATISTIWKTMGRRTAITYILTVAVTAVLAGLLLNRFISPDAIIEHHHQHGASTAWWEVASTWAMLLILLWAFVGKYFKRKTHMLETGAEVQKFKVTGMSCDHCQKAVTSALKELNGIEDAEVDLETGLTLIKGAVNYDAIKAKVEAAGYSIEQIEEAE